MLIENTGPKVGDVVTIRLVTGEEIIGTLGDGGTDKYVKIKKPFNVVMQQGPNGVSYGLGAVLVTGETDDVSLYTTSMIYVPVKARSDIAANYTSTVSGIIVPPKGILKP